MCACSADSDCGAGYCECADARCEHRICSVQPCYCAHGSDCSSPVQDGVRDPNSCASAAACFGGQCLVEMADPGPPSFPEAVATLTAIVRTDADEFAATADTVSLCVAADQCFVLERPDVPDLKAGAVDVFHFENLALPRSQIDRVELRISGSSQQIDDWQPTCVSVRLDGEPVHCVDSIPVVLGDESGSVTSWRDPDGMRVACASCYPSALTHGPMLGAIEPHLARVWVRTDAARRVGLRLSGAPDVTQAPVVDWAYPAPNGDFTAVLVARDLQPNSSYYYGIDIDGAVVSQPEYKFTTPPPAGTPVRFRVAFGSCTRGNHAQDIFAPIAAMAPELFLFAGDIHYGDAATMAALRWHYQWGLSAAARRALFARVPTLAVWDDHDFLGNNSDGTAPERAVARRVFGEYWANPSYGEDGEGIYFKYRYGDVDVFMLDVRYFRDPLDGPVVFGDPQGQPSLLGPAQTEWLLRELTASTATFKLLVSGSQWTANGKSDSWASFLPARDTLFAEIAARNIAGVVLLSGDRHLTERRSIPRQGTYALPELTSSPLANTPRDCSHDDSDLVACHDQGYYVVVAEVDTVAADPVLTATVYLYQQSSQELVPVDEWRILRSELAGE